MKQSFQNSENKTKPDIKKYLIGLVLVALIVASFFGGRRYHQQTSKNFIEKKDSIIESLSKEFKQSLEYTNALENNLYNNEIELNKKDLENERLYKIINQKERLLRSIRLDTSFSSNARKIAEGVNRYYKQKDSIK